MNVIARFGVLALVVFARQTANGQAARFENVADAKGLGDFVSKPGDGHGPGAVFTDLNDDGFADIYLMNAFGGPNALFLNTPQGGAERTFVRAVNDAGAGDVGWSNGAVAGDYDNDGDRDLYVINFDQPNRLYRNQLAETGQFGFVDATALTVPSGGGGTQLGLAGAMHQGALLNESLTAAWGDPDRDGDLDLYVGNHFEYYESPILKPGEIPGQRDIFFRNNGDGTFTDTTMAVGVPGYETSGGARSTPNQNFSSTNAVIFADFNNDLWPDLLVTNKVGGPDDRDMLYINQGAGADGPWQGYATATYTLSTPFGDRSDGAMGVDVGDIDNDGDLDVYITDWSDPVQFPNEGANDLWINQLTETGKLDFIPSDQLPALYSWGTQVEDFDNNGWQDVHVATQSHARDFLYMNSAQGLGGDSAASAGVDQADNSRGDVSADYDRDGLLDLLVINPYDGPSVLYENRSDETAPGHRFLSLLLEGDPALPGKWRTSRDAIGARLTISADLDGDGTVAPNEQMLREVVSGSSNAASTSSLDVEVGLGAATIAVVQILWPSGRTETLSLTANQFVEVRELLADYDGDGAVDDHDAFLWQSEFGTRAGAGQAAGDSDIDGDVDGSDFLHWQFGYGAKSLAGSAGAMTSVHATSISLPEPNGAMLFLAAITLVFALKHNAVERS